MTIALFFIGYMVFFSIVAFICMYPDLKDPKFRKGLWTGQDE